MIITDLGARIYICTECKARRKLTIWKGNTFIICNAIGLDLKLEPKKPEARCPAEKW